MDGTVFGVIVPLSSAAGLMTNFARAPLTATSAVIFVALLVVVRTCTYGNRSAIVEKKGSWCRILMHCDFGMSRSGGLQVVVAVVVCEETACSVDLIGC